MVWELDRLSRSLKDVLHVMMSGRKTGAEMARLFGISQPTVSRIGRRAPESQPRCRERHGAVKRRR